MSESEKHGLNKKNKAELCLRLRRTDAREVAKIKVGEMKREVEELRKVKEREKERERERQAMEEEEERSKE